MLPSEKRAFRDRSRASFEEIGVTGVRDATNSHSYSGMLRTFAAEWLRDKAAEQDATETEAQREIDRGLIHRSNRISFWGVVASNVIAGCALALAAYAAFWKDEAKHDQPPVPRATSAAAPTPGPAPAN